MSAREKKLFVGARLRRLREERLLSQAELARRLALSPSYVNQIERDQRPVPRRILAPLCAALDVGPSYFEDTGETRIVHELREASADPVFGSHAIPLEEALAAARHAPALSERFLTLYRAYLAGREGPEEASVRTTDAAPHLHLPHGSGGAPYEEVRDWVQARRHQFDAVDRAAEALAERLDLTPARRIETLERHLRDAHGLPVENDRTLLASGLVWRLQRAPRRLLLADGTADASRAFWMAHNVGLLEQRRLFEHELRSAAFASEESVALARVSLANTFAGALLMPYRRFLEAARANRYDIERLGAVFGTSFEQVCHRLSTLQRPGLPGLPFFFLKTDIAGHVLKRSSATRFQFARFGGPCPLWNVFSAFARPGRVLVQLARTPDEVSYLTIARTVGRPAGAYLSRPRSVAVLLGCEVEHARLTVYSAGLDLADADAAVPIGPGCRACERVDCRHRAVPPSGHALEIGTGERGVVPYRIQA